LGGGRSYRGLAGSIALHGALLVLIVLGLASAPRFADSPESTAIDTITLSEFNQIAKGEKEAKPAPQPPPAPPTPPEPPPMLRAAETPAPPPPATAAAMPPPRPEPAPPPRPETSPPPRPEPAPPPRLVAEEAPTQPPPRPKIIDAPPERPKEPVPEKPKSARYYDPNAIAKLIGQSKTSSPAIAAPTQTSSVIPQGLPHHDEPRMSLSIASALDAWLTESYLNCWTPPPAMPEGDTYVAQIKVVFNPDGSLSGRPVLLNPPTDPAWRAHAESAMRAVKKCDPLKVPAQYAPYFDQWKVETIHFDPRETQG
jgi:hypothetical protein